MENLKWEVDQKEREIQALKQQLDVTERQGRKELDGTQQLLQVPGRPGLSRRLGGRPQVSAECAQGLQARGRPFGRVIPCQKEGGRRSLEPRATPGPRCVRRASRGSQHTQSVRRGVRPVCDTRPRAARVGNGACDGPERTN